MLRDFLVGTFGKLLQLLFLIGGIIVLVGGIIGGSGVGIAIGIVLLCAAAGVRYALGNVVRVRR